MTPVPLDLPVRPSDAVALVRLVLDAAAGKPLTAEVRARIAARAAALRLETLRPWFGSLVRDPVHRSTCYLAVDAGAPLLLHFAPAAAPTSAVFSNALLIGRAADLVVNAIPFGPADRAALDAFADRLDPALQPRPQGPRSAIVLAPSASAFDAFRGLNKRLGKNLAATEGDYHHALWCAIRAGWREGWSAGIELEPATARDVVRDCPFYTRFTVPGDSLDDAAALHAFIRRTRSAAKIARPFDFELSLEHDAAPTTPGALAEALEFLRAAGHPAQLIAPRLARAEEIDPLAAVARRHHAVLSIRSPWPPPPAARLNYKVSGDTETLDAIASVLA